MQEKKITLEGSEFYHLTKVMRASLGDTIELINGKNQLAKASVLNIAKKHALVTIKSVIEEKAILKKIILAQALVKSSKLDLILEKATELGTSDFILFQAKKSEKTALSANQEKRLKTILISAIKQCGRLDLPTISIFNSLKEIPIQKKCEYYFGDIRKKTPFLSFLAQKNTASICFFIGPEKGFTEEEILFLEHKMLAKGVRLNNNILRTETAAICGAALFSWLN